MSGKLRYSREGFLRRIYMSHTTSVFMLVEGKIVDRYFADKICDSSSVLATAGYEVRLISQIESESGVHSGGKQALIAYYDYCKAQGLLVQRNSTGTKSIAFLADRDAQQLTGGRRRSPHVIYTYYADSEAHVFAEVDELAALMVAASLDSATAGQLLKFLGDWRSGLAQDWRPWIELCCLADAARSRSWVGFGKQRSLIHAGIRGRVLDQNAYAAAIAEVRRTSLYSGAQFNSVQTKVHDKVEEIFAAGREALLLKGKWLPQQLTLLVGDFFANPGGQDYEWDEPGFREAVTRCYASKMLTTGPGARYILGKLEALIS